MSVPLSIVKEITDATSNDLVSTYGYSSIYADYFCDRNKTQAQCRIYTVGIQSLEIGKKVLDSFDNIFHVYLLNALPLISN